MSGPSRGPGTTAVRVGDEPTPVVALFGATGLGKTEVAVRLAELLAAEVVAADAMQVYEGLPVLTNQPHRDLRDRVRYHLVGVVPPQQSFSVHEYAVMAHAAIEEIRSRGTAVIVEGGSGLYLRAALGDLAFAGRPDPQARHELERLWARDPGAVVDELRSLDPATVARLDTANPRRVIRALEAVRSLGRPLTAAERGGLWRPAERYPHRLVALQPDREALRERVERRVDEMLAGGAIEEVRLACAAGPLSATLQQAIGVRELCAYLEGALTLGEAARLMKARTRSLVRRQLTWLRKLPAPERVSTAGRDPAEVAAEVAAALDPHGRMGAPIDEG